MTTDSMLRPTRRRLMASGAAGAALAWLGPQLGWVPRAQAATPPKKPTGQAVIGFSQEPTVLNPLMLHIEVDEGVYFNLFSPLWRPGPDGNLIPDLVSEIPTVENGGISPDGLNWRLKLKDGVKWHDGTPFTAEDVKFTIELINNPNFRAGRRAGHELVRDIQVVSPTELTWKMDKPYAPYPAILSWTFIVPKHILGKEADPNTSSFNTAPVGTGAFKWVERVPGDHITLAANPDFHGEGPYLERLIFKYIPDMTVLYTQYQTGDVNYTGIQGISPDHYEEAKALPGRTVMPVPQPFVENIAFNLGLPVFQEQAVRDALYLGMDKQGIIEAIYYGLPTPTNPSCRRRAGPSTPTCRRTSTIPRRPSRSWRPPAGSWAPTGCARRTACGSSSPTRPRPATTPASRRSSSCSRPGARSAPRCRSTTCRRR